MAKKDKDIWKEIIDKEKADKAERAKKQKPSKKKKSLLEMGTQAAQKWGKEMNPYKETTTSRRKLTKKIEDKIEPNTGLRQGSPITKAERDAANKRRIKRLRKKGNYGK